MKKAIAILMVMAVAFTVAACTKQKQKQQSTKKEITSDTYSYTGIMTDTETYTFDEEDFTIISGDGSEDDLDPSNEITTEKAGDTSDSGKSGSGTTKKNEKETSTKKDVITTPIIPIG